MGTTLVRRPARLAVPDPGSEPIVVAAPPQLADSPGAGMSAAMIIMPVVSGGGGLLIALTNRDNPLYAVAGLLFLVAAVTVGGIMFLSTRLGPRRRLREQRERYLDYLENLRSRLRGVAAAQRRAAASRHPAPDLLPEVVRLPARCWERRVGDADFLHLRVGHGTVPLATAVSLRVVQADPLIAYDPVCLGVADQIANRYQTLTDQPFVVDAGRAGTISVVGDRGAGRRLARALLAQLVAFHSPADVRVAVVRHSTFDREWDAAKWLPHAIDERYADGPLPRRLIAPSLFDLGQLLAEDLEQRGEDLQRRRGRPPGPGYRHLVVIVDGEQQSSLAGLDPGAARSLADLGIHLVLLLGSRREEPETVHERLYVDPDGRVRRDPPEGTEAGVDGAAGPAGPVGTIDDLGQISMACLFRQLSPLRPTESDPEDRLAATVGLADILGVPDVAQLDPDQAWRRRAPRDLLRVPIGVSGDGHPVVLDLKEAGAGGMGPHGLVVGATGSGKSELLRTLVSSLVVAHSPDQLALLLVDFKGGATFAGMAALPHVGGMVTNLADDIALVDRFAEALSGEMLRRQQILKDTGNLSNVAAYWELREAQGAGAGALAPMPYLLVIIDEFSELLAARPDFADLFVAIGRIGRSIGVHLLLATQRLEAGRIRGLESHLSYRIGLRTFSEAESREAIGVPDAFHLPPEPGSGFLTVDTTVFERFKAAMVSHRYEPPRAERTGLVRVLPYTAVTGTAAGLPALPAEPSSPEPVRGSGARTVGQVLVDRLAAAGAARARRVWHDPLPAALPLSAVLLAAEDHPEPDGTVAVLGLADVPSEQRQSPLCWSFDGADGNLVVAGAPQSGKSTLLRTLVAALATRHAPGQVAFYCVDHGGGGLTSLAGLPHVASVATRAEPDLVRRTVADVHAALDDRERLLRTCRIDSAAGLRRAHRRGELPPGGYGDIFLVIDGWGPLREAEPELEDALVDIAARGPALGVHVVLTVVTASQVRTRLAGSFGGRIELRLNDPFDSGIDRGLAAGLPKDTPGRALLVNRCYAQIALPRLDGGAGADDLAAGLADLVERVRGRWPHERVAPVRVLPDRVELSAIPRGDRGARGVIAGLSERTLGPARLDLFGGDPHLVVYGDPQTGKSNLLRLLVHQLTAAYPPDRLGIVMVDFRRTHLGFVPEGHLLAYCTSAPQAAKVAQELSTSLHRRLPGEQVTVEQLRDRSWWTGPEVVVIVDDYDLVATTTGNPLLALAGYVPHGRDVGLHVVLARRTGGAARSLYEPLLQSVSDLAGCGVLFGGDRLEGPLVNGVAAQRLPTGRALIARRGTRPEQAQVAWLDPVPALAPVP
jgi:S-DNA-T family DNA segregation ATPase FtsK/SpoIIIE